jgi:DNA polymerase-3 subunit delta'
VGQAKALVVSEEFREERKAFVSMVNSISRSKGFELSIKAREYVKEKKDVQNLIKQFQVWFRDVLLYKATNDDSYLIYGSDLNSIREMASISYGGIEHIFKELDDANAKISSNVNAEQVLSVLLIKIKEYMK